MSTVQHLREVIQERLTTAAEEIFSEFAKTIVRYEEEISQLRLLNIRPGIKSHNTGLDDQQVCDQERSSSLHQQDPEPPQTREEQKEMCSSEEGEQLELKQEAEGINVWTGEEVDLLWKSGVKLTTVDLPQQHNCKENEDLDDPQVCSQERNPSLNQEDPEQEEMYTNQEGEQLARNQETKGIVVWTGQELGIMWNPEVKLNRIDLPQCDCKDEGGLTDQQVCNRKNNSTLDQEDPSQIKGEQEKLSTTQEGKPHEAGMEEIQAPDMQRPPVRKSSRKTNRGATMPPFRKELRRAPDEGSPQVPVEPGVHTCLVHLFIIAGNHQVYLTSASPPVLCQSVSYPMVVTRP
uniref:uncharacterized protein LOC101474970 n=1 Tax=Maylandia zebra TaxID=106582 RepID=UPI000D318683|nr:uncharacterized protein LOC101474970 [Maylandia zebra]